MHGFQRHIVFRGKGTADQPILLRSEGGYGSGVCYFFMSDDTNSDVWNLIVQR